MNRLFVCAGLLLMMAVISMEGRKVHYRFHRRPEILGTSTCPEVPVNTGNETATNETGTESVDCDDLCVNDFYCAEGMKCCNTGCRMECLKPVSTGKPLPLRLMKRDNFSNFNNGLLE